MNKQLLEYASEYLNISLQEAVEKFENVQKLINEDWHNKKDMKSFYENTEFYIFDLIKFNTHMRIENLVHPLKYASNLKILDYGAGIGEIGMTFSKLNDVYYYDIGKVTQGFAEYVSKKTSRPVTFLTKKEVNKMTFDVIILTDVLEHVTDPIDLIKKLSNQLNPNGSILTTGLNFAVNENLPMHLASNKKFVNEYNGFMNTNFFLMFFHNTVNEVIYLWQRKYH